MSQPDHDVIVIGAGSVGVPTALFLAKGGARVLCLDRHPSAGQGQNKAAIGGVRATHSDPAKIRLCQESLKVFSAWKERTGTDIGWKQGGYCFPIYRERDEAMMQSILPIQKRFELEIDWVDGDEVARAVPGIQRNDLRGGTISPEDGQVSPLLAIEAFKNEAVKDRVEFKFGETVMSMITEGDGQAVTGVRTDKAEYHAPTVVNAAGARASQICEMVNVDIPVKPDSHEAGITAPVKPFLDPLVVDIRPGPEGKTTNFYFGQVESGQVIFCYTPKGKFYGEDRRCTSEFMPVIARRLVDLIPRLRNLTVRRLWRGLYPMTPDGLAVVGKAPGISGLYLAMGMCGQGFMLGPGVGANLASLILKGQPLMEPEIFNSLSPERDYGGREAERLA